MYVLLLPMTGSDMLNRTDSELARSRARLNVVARYRALFVLLSFVGNCYYDVGYFGCCTQLSQHTVLPVLVLRLYVRDSAENEEWRTLQIVRGEDRPFSTKVRLFWASQAILVAMIDTEVVSFLIPTKENIRVW